MFLTLAEGPSDLTPARGVSALQRSRPAAASSTIRRSSGVVRGFPSAGGAAVVTRRTFGTWRSATTPATA